MTKILVILGFILCTPFFGVAGETQPKGKGRTATSPSDITYPATITQAVEHIKIRLMKAQDLEWVLRNPKDVVVTDLHLPFGTFIRNEFGLWGRNKKLLAACGNKGAEDCSHIIFEALWFSVRNDAEPQVVKNLDCHFQLTQRQQVKYQGFYLLTLGDVLKNIQNQIDEQTASATAVGDCPNKLIFVLEGNPDLSCWVRAEFSEDGRDPVSLERFWGWFSWRNGFTVKNDPPKIILSFHNACSWKERPMHFLPDEIAKRK